jgi:hypothetical protein
MMWSCATQSQPACEMEYTSNYNVGDTHEPRYLWSMIMKTTTKSQK